MHADAREMKETKKPPVELPPEGPAPPFLIEEPMMTPYAALVRNLPEIKRKTEDKAVEEAIRRQTEPGRDQHIENRQSSQKILATALREVEKTMPLKAGLEYIKKNLRPNLPEHLPLGYRLPSNSTIKGIVSKMKRGQL